MVQHSHHTVYSYPFSSFFNDCIIFSGTFGKGIVSLFQEFVTGADSFGQLSNGISNSIVSGIVYWLIVAIVMGTLFIITGLIIVWIGYQVGKIYRKYCWDIISTILAKKNIITESDLYGRTLMVGGGSPAALKSVQQRLISSKKIDYFNSPDHDTTLTNVASGRGVCLAPGFLNDHSNQFTWIPFDCKENFSCVLCTLLSSKRWQIFSYRN